MNIVCIALGIVIIIVGFLFAIRKLLPKEWKNMPDLEKEKIKIKPLCLNIGAMIAICGAILLMRGLWDAFVGKAFIITMIIWFVFSGLDIFIITKSKHYYNK